MSKPTAVITVGISCSGKSTRALELVKEGFYEINRDWIRFNLVQPGQDWRNYKFNKANEDKVSDIQGKMIMEASLDDLDIVISDTNLHAGRRAALIKYLEDLGYTVRIEALPVSLTEAWKRDTYRLNGVGRDVIYRQWQQWNEYVGRKTYKPNQLLPKAIIVDIDGTVAEMDGRGPFEWQRVDEDKPRTLVIEMVRGYQNRGYRIIFVSGRSDECREKTELWLDRYVGHWVYDGLLMRKAGDFRKDDAVKEEIFWTQLADSYNIVGVIDDRPQVVRLWHDLKIENVICVGNPYTEF